jgi:tetratricopeptide (TPR) repeat protein
LGVKSLLQSEASFSSDELSNPFVCMRSGRNADLAQAAQLNLSDGYLRGLALCLAGKGDAGLTAIKEAGGQSNAEVQYAASLSAIDPQAGADALAGVGLSGEDLLRVVQKLSNQPEVNPYPILRLLAQKANAQPETWILWMQATSRLEAVNEWQAALDWLVEGLTIAPPNARGSLYLGVGWIRQTQPNLLDYHVALGFYNQAIEIGGWIYPDDEVNAHIFRGDIYRTLKDEFDPVLALEEYVTALKLQPGNYGALIRIGSVWYEMKDMDKAEAYYRQALSANDQAPEAYFYMGVVYQARGDKQTAGDWYRQALDHRPNYQPALDSLKALEGK